MSKTVTVTVQKPAAKTAVTKPIKAPTVEQMAAAVGTTVEKAKASIAASKKAAAKPAPTIVPPAPPAGDMSPAFAAIMQQAAKVDAGKKAAPAVKKAAPAEKKVAGGLDAAKQATSVDLLKRTAKKGQVIHVIAEAARPGGGRALFAHTHAALQVFGLLDASRPAVAQATLLTVMGQRAITYHLKERNFEAAPDHGIRLSSIGLIKFRDRASNGQIDGKLANGFMSLFLDGEVKDSGIAKGNLYQAKF